MKKPETYRRCEYCDKLILDVSPIAAAQYEAGMAEIRGTLLLPKAIVARNKKCKNETTNHAAVLDGMYCSVDCLINRINQEMGRKK
jgi:hypothetical protein